MKFILRFKEKWQLRGPQKRYSHGPAPLRVWETPPLPLMHTCPPNLTPFPLAEFFVVVRRKEEEKERVFEGERGVSPPDLSPLHSLTEMRSMILRSATTW